MNSRTEPRHGVVRITAFGLVLAAHFGLLALLGPIVQSPDSVGAPAMLVDMAPLATPVRDPAPPVPDITPVQEPPSLAPQPAPPALADISHSEPVQPDAQLPDIPIPPVPQFERPPVVVPRRVQTVARSRPASPPVDHVEQQPVPVPQPVTAPPPAASFPGSAEHSVSWQTRLLAHLGRYKRYPADAQMRHRQGTAVVHLRLLPNGSVEAVRLQAGSGTDALDQEALALVARAQPLPVPEGETGAIEISVPIQFTIR